MYKNNLIRNGGKDVGDETEEVINSSQVVKN